MIYYTADLHLGHANIMKLSGRPFESVEEMNEALVNNWNAVVSKNDGCIYPRRCDVQNEQPSGEFPALHERQKASDCGQP